MQVRLQLGERSIDLMTGRLDDGATLRPLELRVLQVLARAAPESVTAQRLLTEAFGYSGDSRSQTLYTTVRRLRQAVEPDPDAPTYVLSARGVGYRLAVSAPAPIPTAALPPEPGPLVGREGPSEQLAAARAPVVTLIGPGGGGKSRLALHHAHHLAGSGERIAWVADPGRALYPALAAALRTEPVLDAIVDRIDGGVLVVDDVTDAIEDARALARALAPGARLVVTSASPLDVPGEQVLEVGPLAPDDALELLVARVAEQRGGAWTPTEAERETLRRIAERLDHLPLGLELAAVRLGSFAPELLLEQLDRQPGLAGRRPGAPDRHHSLRALVAWTWDRLDPQERAWIGSLSVLEGSFDLPVAAAALGPLGEDWDVGAVLTHLHRRGLLAASFAARRPFRHLASVVRVLRGMVPAELSDAALDRVAEHTAERARDRPLSHRVFDGGQDADGTEAALRRALASGAPEPERLRFVLCGVLVAQARLPALEREAAAALAGATDPEICAALLLTLGRARWIWGRHDAGVDTLRRGFDDLHLPALGRCRLGLALALREGHRGRRREALEVLETIDGLLGALLPEEADDISAESALMRGLLLSCNADSDRAADQFARAESMYMQLGHTFLALMCRATRGNAHVEQQRPLEAMGLLRQAHDEIRELAAAGDPSAIRQQVPVGAYLIRGLSRVDAAASAALGDDLVLVARRHGNVATVFDAEREWIEALVLAGRIPEAATALQRLERRPRSGPPQEQALEGLRALLALATDRPAEAEAPARRAVALADPVELLPAVERLAEVLVALDRTPEAEALLDEALAEAPPTAVPSARMLVHRAELARERGDLARALDAIRQIGAHPREVADRCLALAAAGHMREASSLAPHAADADGTLSAWLALFAARADGTTLSTTAPPYRATLRRALRRHG